MSEINFTPGDLAILESLAYGDTPSCETCGIGEHHGLEPRNGCPCCGRSLMLWEADFIRSDWDAEGQWIGEGPNPWT